MFCCTWAVGCRKFVQYVRILCPGRFILVESVLDVPKNSIINLNFLQFKLQKVKAILGFFYIRNLLNALLNKFMQLFYLFHPFPCLLWRKNHAYMGLRRNASRWKIPENSFGGQNKSGSTKKGRCLKFLSESSDVILWNLFPAKKVAYDLKVPFEGLKSSFILPP